DELSNYCPMAFEGFEKSRNCLKFCCPAKAYGIECKNKNSCKNGTDGLGRIVRVSLDFDRRIFTPLSRSSYKWKGEYKRRTAVERVNSRIDTSFGFENHTIRGLNKMRCKVGIALVVMLAMAVGRIKANQIENIRSLIKKAA
ncbi:transposase, partial [bacterium]|nr:transposase [bacterium]